MAQSGNWFKAGRLVLMSSYTSTVPYKSAVVDRRGLDKMRSLLILFTVSYLSSIATAQSPVSSPGNHVVCYFTSWSSSRKPPNDFQPEDIDPFLCTHVIYAFVYFGKNYDFDTTQGNFTELQPRLVRLKRRNPKLKVMMAMGGYKEGSTGFAEITKNQTTRLKFAKNLVAFLRVYAFDGIDLNWQHPTIKNGNAQDPENYVYLAQLLREEFDNEAEESGSPKLLLSISITQKKELRPVYDISNFNTYMDFISVLCYDYVFSFTTVVLHHAPLHALPNTSSKDYEEDNTLNIDYTIDYFLEQVYPWKLVLGIPTYGRTKKLVNPEDTYLGADADGPGEKGPYTGEDGFLSYYEICLKIKDENWTIARTKPYGSVGPHAFKGNQWVGYDDVDMVRTKARYAKQRGLAGVVFWTIDYDDFLGTCDKRKFPLISAAKEELNSIPAAKEELNPIPGAKEELNPIPAAKEELNSIPAAKEELDFIPAAKEELNSIPAAKEELNSTPAREESIMLFPEEPKRRLVPSSARSRPRTTYTTEVVQTEPPTRPPTRPSTRLPTRLPTRPPTRPPTTVTSPPTVTSSSPRASVIDSPQSIAAQIDATDESQNDGLGNDLQPDIVGDLIQLIEKAGGMKSFCKILRDAKLSYKRTRGTSYPARRYEDMVVDVPNLAPLRLLVSNSSITIQELNIYGNS